MVTSWKWWKKPLLSSASAQEEFATSRAMKFKFQFLLSVFARRAHPYKEMALANCSLFSFCSANLGCIHTRARTKGKEKGRAVHTGFVIINQLLSFKWLYLSPQSTLIWLYVSPHLPFLFYFILLLDC